MTEVVVNKSIQVSADNAWNKIASFRGIEEFSPIERSITEGSGEGATRTCFMPDGAEINEVLSKVDNPNKELQYKITNGPFPITGYLSTVKVEAIDSHNSKVTWGSEFEAADEVKEQMVELFEGFYHNIIDSLEVLIKE